MAVALQRRLEAAVKHASVRRNVALAASQTMDQATPEADAMAARMSKKPPSKSAADLWAVVSPPLGRRGGGSCGSARRGRGRAEATAIGSIAAGALCGSKTRERANCARQCIMGSRGGERWGFAARVTDGELRRKVRDL
eukprot:5913867-Pleurochrysis_carterae.AAC.1